MSSNAPTPASACVHCRGVRLACQGGESQPLVPMGRPPWCVHVWGVPCWPVAECGSVCAADPCAAAAARAAGAARGRRGSGRLVPHRVCGQGTPPHPALQGEPGPRERKRSEQAAWACLQRFLPWFGIPSATLRSGLCRNRLFPPLTMHGPSFGPLCSSGESRRRRWQKVNLERVPGCMCLSYGLLCRPQCCRPDCSRIDPPLCAWPSFAQDAMLGEHERNGSFGEELYVRQDPPLNSLVVSTDTHRPHTAANVGAKSWSICLLSPLTFCADLSSDS